MISTTIFVSIVSNAGLQACRVAFTTQDLYQETLPSNPKFQTPTSRHHIPIQCLSEEFTMENRENEISKRNSAHWTMYNPYL